MEEWKEIQGFPKYEVSSLGRLRSKDRVIECLGLGGSMCKKTIKSKILKPYEGVRGYLVNNIRAEMNKPQTVYLHRLIAEAFIPNPKNKPVIDHINRNKLDNSISNLRWTTYTENCLNKDKESEDYITQTYIVTVPGSSRRHFQNYEEAKKYRDDCIDSICQD